VLEACRWKTPVN